MNTLVLVLVVISSVCSAITSCTYAYIAWKKSKEPPRDEAWEAAIRLICSGVNVDAESFAELYEKLAIYAGPMRKQDASRLDEFAHQVSELAHKVKNGEIAE